MQFIFEKKKIGGRRAGWLSRCFQRKKKKRTQQQRVVDFFCICGCFWPGFPVGVIESSRLFLVSWFTRPIDSGGLWTAAALRWFRLLSSPCSRAICATARVVFDGVDSINQWMAGWLSLWNPWELEAASLPEWKSESIADVNIWLASAGYICSREPEWLINIRQLMTGPPLVCRVKWAFLFPMEQSGGFPIGLRTQNAISRIPAGVDCFSHQRNIRLV